MHAPIVSTSFHNRATGGVICHTLGLSPHERGNPVPGHVLKKLTGAARCRARGRDVEYALWPEHEVAIAAWRLVCDQWHVAPSGRLVRLDWPAVKVLLNAAGVAFVAEARGCAAHDRAGGPRGVAGGCLSVEERRQR